MPLMHSLTRTALLAGVLLLTKGCSALLPQQTLELPDNIEACQAFLARIDQAIAIVIDSIAALRGWRRRTDSSTLCRRGSTPFWASGACACPAVSGSGSPLRAPS